MEDNPGILFREPLLLDLLIDGESSFAMLYAGLARHYGYSGAPELVFRQLLKMRDDGLVRIWRMTNRGLIAVSDREDLADESMAYATWLPGATFEEVAVDDIGVWFEITTEGRHLWRTEYRAN